MDAGLVDFTKPTVMCDVILVVEVKLINLSLNSSFETVKSFFIGSQAVL